MARVVYVILAHSEPTNLAGLVASLWNPDDAFEIWIDPDNARSLEPYLGFLLDYGRNVRVHTGRSMCWGGYSLVQTTLDAYAALEADGPHYSHAVLVSGTHVPLIGADGIYESIRQLPGWLDVATVGIPEGDLTFVDQLDAGWAKDILQRLRFSYHEVPSIGMLPVAKRDRWARNFIHKGGQWHILRRDQVQFLLSQAPALSRLLADVHVADELFIQNALCDSPEFPEFRKSEHVYAEWVGASPRRISFSELPGIQSSGRFPFARKAPVDATIDQWVEMIQGMLPNAEGIERLRSFKEKAERYRFRSGSYDAALPELRRVQAEAIASAVLDRPAEHATGWRHLAKGGSSAWLIGEPVAEIGGAPIHLVLFFQWGRGCTFALVRPCQAVESNDLGHALLPIPHGPFTGFSILAPDALTNGHWWTVSTQDTVQALAAAIKAQIAQLEHRA